MDALTALLRHIKLEPLIGGATPAPPSATKPLTDAPIAAAGAGAAADGHADATAPDSDPTRLVREVIANSAKPTGSIVKNPLIDMQNGPASAYTRISPNASALSQAVSTALSNQEPLPPAPALNVAGTPPAQVAQSLNVSLSQTGVFYESHLQQWVAGERSLESVRVEPHNRLAAGTMAAGAMNQGGALKASELSAMVATVSQAVAESAAGPGAPANALALPEALQPIVREQLNALDLQRVLWHGEVWPQQHAELEIAEEYGARQQDGEQDKAWLSTLRIELPGLGVVVAHISLNDEGASVRLRAAPAALESLKAGGAEFRDAMEASGIALRQLELREPDDSTDVSTDVSIKGGGNA